MTLHQYISAGASVAGFLAALATFLTVWQIAKQRRATYRPDIVVKRARVITLEDKSEEKIIAPLLTWRRSEERIDAQRDDILGRDYPLLLVNIGLGAATNLSATWEFPMVSFVASMGMLAVNRGYPEKIEYNNGALTVSSPQITSLWRNQKQDHFDYLLPAAIDKEPARIDLPSAYILAVATRMSFFLRDVQRKDGDGEAPQIPPLQLSLAFNDIAGKRHYMSYEIEFYWHCVTPRAFEAELIPKRVC